MVSRRRTRARSRPNRLSSKSVHRIIRKAEFGVEIRPSAKMPSVTTAPWWPYTLVFLVDKTTTMSAKELHNGLITTLGFQTTEKLNLRILSVRVWGVVDKPISLDIYEQVAGKHKLRQLSDFGSAIEHSRIGYRFGVQRYIDAMQVMDETAVFAIDGYFGTTTKKETARVFVQLMFQRVAVPAPSSLNATRTSESGYVIVTSPMAQLTMES